MALLVFANSPGWNPRRLRGRGLVFRTQHKGHESGIGMSFRSIVERAAGGDDEALAVLYGNHIAMVSGYLRACGVADPDDLTAEVFVGMLRGLHRFEGDQPEFRRWLMTIAHRRLVDHRRRHLRNKTELVDPILLEREIEPAELFPTPVDGRLVVAFEQLTSEQREVLGLRFIADLSLEGVADVTGRSVGAVKSMQSRALSSLRRALSTNTALGSEG